MRSINSKDSRVSRALPHSLYVCVKIYIQWIHASSLSVYITRKKKKLKWSAWCFFFTVCWRQSKQCGTATIAWGNRPQQPSVLLARKSNTLPGSFSTRTTTVDFHCSTSGFSLGIFLFYFRVRRSRGHFSIVHTPASPSQCVLCVFVIHSSAILPWSGVWFFCLLLSMFLVANQCACDFIGNRSRVLLTRWLNTVTWFTCQRHRRRETSPLKSFEQNSVHTSILKQLKL